MSSSVLRVATFNTQLLARPGVRFHEQPPYSPEEYEAKTAFIGGLLERLIYLAQGLAVILAFIGVKLVFHALHVNELPFINGGEPLLWVPEIPIGFSLLFIGSTIAVATLASLLKTRRTAERDNPRLPDGAAAVDGVTVGEALESAEYDGDQTSSGRS